MKHYMYKGSFTPWSPPVKNVTDLELFKVSRACAAPSCASTLAGWLVLTTAQWKTIRLKQKSSVRWSENCVEECLFQSGALMIHWTNKLKSTPSVLYFFIIRSGKWTEQHSQLPDQMSTRCNQL